MILAALLFFIFSPGVFYTIPPWFSEADQNTSLTAAAVHAILFGIVYYCIFKGLDWQRRQQSHEGFQSGSGGRKAVGPKLDIEDVQMCYADTDCKPNLMNLHCRDGRCKS